MTESSTVKAPLQPRKAYSYLRFSTPEQSKGDSFRRQMSMAAEYAARKGLDLDQELTFHDVGVSAYRGQNADAGRLAYFLEAVRSGQVPQGSVLLVEQLDRLSRLAPRRALRVLEDIVETGVGVVTLNDGKEYTAASLDTEHMDLMMSILTFMRANEESATKSRRLKAAWEGKRLGLSEGKPLTRKLPAWLTLSEDRQRIEVVQDRAELVRRVFSMALAGVGQHRIAATFNREGRPPWGRGAMWHRSYIAKLLTNPAVIGTFQPHLSEYDGTRKLRKALEPVEGYFPAVVSEEDFREARALRQAHTAAQRGRHAHSPITHILAGLAVCGKCGASMTRVMKGARSRPGYVCTRAKGGAGCEYRSVRCDLVEAALLQGLPERLRDLDGASGKDESLEAEVQSAADRVHGLQEVMEVLLDNLSYERSPAIVQRLGAIEDDLEEAQGALRRLRERQEAATGRTVGVRIERALEALQPPSGDPVVEAVNRTLRLIFRKAVIDRDAHRVCLEWTHGGTCIVPYPGFSKWTGPGWVWTDEETTNDQ